MTEKRRKNKYSAFSTLPASSYTGMTLTVRYKCICILSALFSAFRPDITAMVDWA